MHKLPHFASVPSYTGRCDVEPNANRLFYKGKIVGVQHFESVPIAAGSFNPLIDFASPLDGDEDKKYHMIMQNFVICQGA